MKLRHFCSLHRRYNNMLPKRRFWKTEHRVGRAGRTPQSWSLRANERKITRKDTPDPLFRFPKCSFGEHRFVGFARACDFEGLCEGVSTRFGLRTLAKYLENTRPTRCSVFQHLRLGSINNRYRTSTGESNRSMCDDACCDFLAKRYNSRYRTSTGESKSVDVR